MTQAYFSKCAPYIFETAQQQKSLEACKQQNTIMPRLCGYRILLGKWENVNKMLHLPAIFNPLLIISNPAKLDTRGCQTFLYLVVPLVVCMKNVFILLYRTPDISDSCIMHMRMVFMREL